MLPEASRMNRIFGLTTVPVAEVPMGVVDKSVSAAKLEHVAALDIANIADRTSLQYLRLGGWFMISLS
jgi:hypothetical protein